MEDSEAMQLGIEQLSAALAVIVGAEQVIRDSAALELLSSDVYSAGVTAAIAISPTERAQVAEALGAITAAGFCVVPRGGGMSYTAGYTPIRSNSVIVDLRRLNNIVNIDAEDMTITVEAGVTWKQIYDALQPLGLRLPFFGTFSGSVATVGGGMSNGALFMGSGRYGTAAEIVLGLEVATANGQLLKTGQAAFKNGRPFYRTYGPDLTGLFVHDAGSLGVKTLVSMRLIRPPPIVDYASFVFDNMQDASRALTDVSRCELAEEVFIFDPEATRRSLDGADLRRDLKRLLGVIKAQPSLGRGLREGIKLVGAGRNFIDSDLYSLHVVCSGRCDAAIASDLAEIRRIVEGLSGGEIANSIPKGARANPFEPLNGILGSTGDRWAALNCKVAHSDAAEIIASTDAIFADYESEMRDAGVTFSRLCIGLSNHVFSFEPVLRWNDVWLPLHRNIPEPSHLATLTEPESNPVARKLVDKIRDRIVLLFAEFGAASNQIGKTYHYFDSLNPVTAALVLDLKRSLDPKGLMNPGALRIPFNPQQSVPGE